MICNNCQKLSFVIKDRFCLSCQKNTNSKIKVICENCSDAKNQCQVCLKQTKIEPTKISSSCNACTGRK